MKIRAHNVQVSRDMFQSASPRQKEFLEAYFKYGSCVEAAKHLGIAPQTVSQSLRRLNKRENILKGVEGSAPDNRKILVIGDLQTQPNTDMLHILCIGRYWLAKKPSTVVLIGDFADMASLSSYDKGKRSYEGARYKNDIEASITAMKILLSPIIEYNKSREKQGLSLYKPKMILTLGNHEDRIDRATQVDPMLYGTISIEDLKYKEFGWEVHPFLDVVVLNNIAFSHYFGSGSKNLPCGTAQQQLNKMHMSCIAGHQQGRQTATTKRADGKRMTSIIAGSSYDFDLPYLGLQGNKHWRGIIMLHNVEDGEFDEVYVPINYLKERYGKGEGPIIYSPELK